MSTTDQNRLRLQTLLEELGATEEEPDKRIKVYFQPPANTQMEYPCIVFARERRLTRFAGNRPYKIDKGYSLTVIYQDPDDDLPDRVALLPKCTFDRYYGADNLHHEVFTIFF